MVGHTSENESAYVPSTVCGNSDEVDFMSCRVLDYRVSGGPLDGNCLYTDSCVTQTRSDLLKVGACFEGETPHLLFDYALGALRGGSRQ